MVEDGSRLAVEPVTQEQERELTADICAAFGNDPGRMLDILLAVQRTHRCVSPNSIQMIAECTGQKAIQVRGVASFYAFLSETPKGRVTIRLCDDIVDRFTGLDAVREAFEAELGVRLGQTSPDGAFSLDVTPCIGMCDQAPAAMINDVIVTSLTPERAREIAAQLRAGATPGDLVSDSFDELSPIDRVREMVASGIRQTGPVLLGEIPQEAGLKRAVATEPSAILDMIEASGLRGCGGAGYISGRKWRSAATTPSDRRFIICNADEGEPGTFKDRVLLTECPHLMIEGMTVAARAFVAGEGLIYLRGEYAYLREHLEDVLAERRARRLLGRNILGLDGFDFDIRIQMGAGAYICGEESALINSCEGLPGEPRTRPPYPATSGYLGCPTVVQNVETFCHAARILGEGAEWFRAMGTEGSHGTKLFSISGDCASPGVYEWPYGKSVQEMLEAVGAEDAAAVLVGGPSGTMIGRDSFDRKLTFDDLATGGAIVVFSGERNILEIVEYYMSFFEDESCGYCTPCRVGTVFLRKALEKFRAGKADAADIDYLRDLSGTIMETSRCGLGMTAPNPVLSTLENFPLVYSAMVKPAENRQRATFDIQSAISDARTLAKRRSHIFDQDFGA